jgi:hypothetical protein
LKIKLEDVTIGADPELFVREAAGRRRFISGHGMIPGTKEAPHPVEGGAVQVDGMALEYNVDPCKTAQAFVDTNNRVLAQLSQMVPDVELCAMPMARFTETIWENAPKEAKILGCDPDYDAYTGQRNDAPEPPKRVRTAAGHVHVGWVDGMDPEDIGHNEACKLLAIELDYYLGLPALVVDHSDASQSRRSSYGRAGTYRAKPYGVEYRTLSNFWVGSDRFTHWVFNNAKLAVANLLKGQSSYGKFPVKDFINASKLSSNHILEVKHYCGDNSIPLPTA